MGMNTSIADPDVAKAFNAFPPAVRVELMRLRAQIFSVAKETVGVGELEETLKWGQPSYLTTMSKSGSTIRIGREKKTEGDFAIYFKCQTSLVTEFRERYKSLFRYEGNRAILFRVGEQLPEEELSQCIAMALTYKRSRRSGDGQRSTRLG